MSDSTVKGFTPAQMAPYNLHRERGPVRAVGLTFLDKAQIIMGCLLGLGATLMGLCMLWAMARAMATVAPL